jgi:hypothetical protein
MQIAQLLNPIRVFVRKAIANRQVDNAAEMNDRSYEDSLLDLQMRSLLRAEYGGKEPSADVYVRLMHAVRLYNQGQQQPRSGRAGFIDTFSPIGARLGQAMIAFYRTGSRADSGRLVSGMLVAVLLVLAMTPDLMQALNGGGPLSSTARLTGTVGDIRVIPVDAQSLPSARLNDKERKFIELKMNEYIDAPVQREEPNQLHPFELGITPLQPELEHPRFPRIQE